MTFRLYEAHLGGHGVGKAMTVYNECNDDHTLTITLVCMLKAAHILLKARGT